MNPKSLRSALTFLCLAFLGLAAPAALRAATIIPPRDLGELALMSDAVVLARALDARGEATGALPHTVTRFELLRQVAGPQLPATFEVSEPGGTADGVTALVPGAPAYREGATYLLFLDRSPEGSWRSQMLAYGLLEEVPGADELKPLPEAPEVGTIGKRVFEPIGHYRQEALLRHLGELQLGGVWDRARVAAEPGPLSALSEPVETTAIVEAAQPNQPAACLFLGQDTATKAGTPYRWRFDSGATATVFAATPGQVGLTGGGASAVQQATAAWTNHPDSVINFTYGGTVAQSITCAGSFDRQGGAVVFNDPCNDIADLNGCSGTLAFGGTFASGTHSWDSGSWFSANLPYVVVNNGAQCIGATSFAEMMTHELGHSLGFGHHSIAAAPNNPTMSAVLKGDGRGASLRGMDKTCAAFAYHTFKDVPISSPSWKWIEAIENAGVTSGCGNGNYCPGNSVTREQMAVFLLRAKEGASYSPPACVLPTFLDMPCTSSFASWVNELAARDVTGGCGLGRYCPGNAVSRASMAVFLLATLEGPSYSPPACTAPVFSDVPCSSPYAPWINQLAARGLTTGCGGGKYCPGNPVNRASMAVFLAATFGLPTP